jgi:hypothetical protein
VAEVTQQTRQELEAALLDMERLLRRVGEYGRAELLRQKCEQLPTEPQSVLDWLASAAVWGSSGTLWDVIICAANHHVSDDFERDDRQFAELLLHLLRLLRAAGWEKPHFAGCETVLQHRTG